MAYLLISFAVSILTTCIAPIVAVIGAGIAARRAPERRLDIRIRWWFIGAIGVGAVLVCLSFLFAPTAMAGLIGYSRSNDFQREVAVANLGFGVIAVLSLRSDARARFGFTIGYAVFLWGALLGHVWQAVAHGDLLPGNIGGILLYDLLVPLVALLLIRAELRRGRPGAAGEVQVAG